MWLLGSPNLALQLIYIDPPFNTGRVQTRRTLETVEADGGDRTGFGGRRYATRLLAESSYLDTFDDYLSFLEPRLRHAHRLLAQTGTFYFHIDYREAHYCKLLLDEIFGRECFLNEIIWSYDYGARSKRRWPCKHDTILVYVRDADAYYYDGESVDREPYIVHGPRSRHTSEGGTREAPLSTRIVARRARKVRYACSQRPKSTSTNKRKSGGEGIGAAVERVWAGHLVDNETKDVFR